MDECVDNFCKRRAEYLRRSLVIVHTRFSQWQAAFMREVGVLAEISVTEQVLREISKFQILGKLSMHKQCVPGFFLPAHAQEPGNEAKVSLAPCWHLRLLIKFVDHLTTDDNIWHV